MMTKNADQKILVIVSFSAVKRRAAGSGGEEVSFSLLNIFFFHSLKEGILLLHFLRLSWVFRTVKSANHIST